METIRLGGEFEVKTDNLNRSVSIYQKLINDGVYCVGINTVSDTIDHVLANYTLHLGKFYLERSNSLEIILCEQEKEDILEIFLIGKLQLEARYTQNKKLSDSIKDLIEFKYQKNLKELKYFFKIDQGELMMAEV